MKYTYSALVLVLILLIGMLINIFIAHDNEKSMPIIQKDPAYHFMIVTRDNNDPFWPRFKEGALVSGLEKNIFVEFIDIPHKDPALIERVVDRAVLSQVDGIAFQPYDVEISSNAVAKTMEAGIATIVYETDVYYIPDVPTVGSNSYEIGYTAGEMAAAVSGGQAKIALIVNEPGIDDPKQYNNIKLQGLLDAISRYPEITLERIYSLNTKMFEVDKLTMSMLAENPGINLIICSDGENTPGVAQVVIDMGRVGDINIIGFGSMPKTIEYIKEGVIYGTIVADSYEIGYNTVTQLADMCSGKQISEVLNSGIYTFTSENISDYN